MKLWKSATFAFMLCGAALSVFLIRNKPTAGRFEPRINYPQSPSLSSSSTSSESKSPLPSLAMQLSSSLSTSSSSSSSSSSSTMGGLQKAARATDSISSLLSEFTKLLHSFTEGEMQQVIGTLVDRKARRDTQVDSQAKRTKRTKRRLKPCSLHELELTVSELGLGYDSDEILLFRYCSGKCTVHRRNYDITLEHMQRTGLIMRREKVQYNPCCRPITYETDISFLDNSSIYHTIHEVSAQECGCV